MLQQYVNQELPDVQTGFRKGRGTRDQIANIRWIIEKAREFQKNVYFCFIDYAKAFDCVDHNKLWKILKEMGIPDHLTCLLRNRCAGQEATVRTGHGRGSPRKSGNCPRRSPSAVDLKRLLPARAVAPRKRKSSESYPRKVRTDIFLVGHDLEVFPIPSPRAQ